VVAPSTGSVVLVRFPFSDLSQVARGHRWPDAGHASCLVVDPTVTGTAEAARPQKPHSTERAELLTFSFDSTFVTFCEHLLTFYWHISGHIGS
jgi:hypothetical protein